MEKVLSPGEAVDSVHAEALWGQCRRYHTQVNCHNRDDWTRKQLQVSLHYPDQGDCRRFVWLLILVTYSVCLGVLTFGLCLFMFTSPLAIWRFCLATRCVSTAVVKVSHRHTKVASSRFCLERHYWAEVESVEQKEMSSVNRRTVVNNQQL